MDVLLELARHNVREYLELPVTVCAKTGVGVDPVLVNDTERTK